MAHVAHVSPHPIPVPEFLFQSLLIEQRTPGTGRKGASFAVSLTVHVLLVAAIVIVPLLFNDVIPQPSEAILKAFFVAPAESTGSSARRRPGTDSRRSASP